MSSLNAVKVQGSVLQVGQTPGAAKVITAISQGYPALIGSAAHGFTQGQVVAIAAVVGMVQMNGLYGVVINPTTNTFQLAGIDSTAFTAYTSGGTATGAQVPVNGVTGFSAFSGTIAVIDTTDLNSQAMENEGGLQDFGTFSLDLQINDSDPGQNVLRSSQAAGVPSPFTLTYPNTHGRTFTGYITSTPEGAKINGILIATWPMRLSGRVLRF